MQLVSVQAASAYRFSCASRQSARAASAQRLCLPTYPFAKKRYWFNDHEDGEAKPAEARSPSQAKHHASPLDDAAAGARFKGLLEKLH